MGASHLLGELTARAMLPIASTMSLPRLAIGAFCAGCLVACQLAYPTNDLVGGPQPADVDGSAADARVASGDAAADSADADAGAIPTKCTPGVAVVAPIELFDPIPASGNLPACRLQNAAATDGVGAGLDHSGATAVFIDNTDVTSCIAARFEGTLASATVRMRAIADACGHPCDGTTCGTGRNASTFVGADVATLQSLDYLTITGEFAPYPFTMRVDDRVVVVCRTTQGPARDDIEVDSILGTCL
jgi:hypothetical protein